MPRVKKSRTQRLVALGGLLISAAPLIGWKSPWLGVVCFAVGVGTVALDLHERRQKGVDDPTVLGLHR
jgi:hypothetical protein